MVSDRYILAKAKPPPAWKNRLEQEVIPAVIDAVAAVEMRMEEVARGVRSRPLAGVTCAVAVGVGLGLLASGRKRTRR